MAWTSVPPGSALRSLARAHLTNVMTVSLDYNNLIVLYWNHNQRGFVRFVEFVRLHTKLFVLECSYLTEIQLDRLLAQAFLIESRPRNFRKANTRCNRRNKYLLTWDSRLISRYLCSFLNYYHLRSATEVTAIRGYRSSLIASMALETASRADRTYLGHSTHGLYLVTYHL